MPDKRFTLPPRNDAGPGHGILLSDLTEAAVAHGLSTANVLLDDETHCILVQSAARELARLLHAWNKQRRRLTE